MEWSMGSMQGSLSRERGEGPRAPFQRKKRRVRLRERVRRYACKMRRCSRDCDRMRVEDDVKGMDSMHIDRWRIWPQRLADEGELPKPCMGWRYKRPPE
jgi:hypothetical protein